MSDEPDLIVVRAHPDLPDGFLPPSVEGRWYDRARLPKALSEAEAYAFGGAVAVVTDQFEVRDDGAVAQVFEVRR